MPFAQRMKLWEKYKAKSRKHRPSTVVSQEIAYGSHVCMKNSPIYQAGAIGFTIANGMPKVGQLLSSVWNLDAICRFKILPAGVLPSNSTSDKRESNGSSNSNSNSSKSSHKETADRIDMPPPPSPASSTCSDTSITTSHSKYELFIIY